MYSAAAEALDADVVEMLETALPTDRWNHFPCTQISHHGEACCEVAREWIVAMDFAQLNGGSLASGPRWIRERYEWGPSAWPIHWCEVISRKVIDCGAHQALAHEVFAARGQTAFRAQFVQKYSADAMDQWRRKWAREDVPDGWLADDVIYHEGNALLVAEDEVKLWDGSAGWWINPRQAGGYGSLIAVRIFAPEYLGGDEGLRWGDQRIRPNEWKQIS